MPEHSSPSLPLHFWCRSAASAESLAGRNVSGFLSRLLSTLPDWRLSDDWLMVETVVSEWAGIYMFNLLGKVVVHAWPAFLVGWASILVATLLCAPPWTDVAEERELAL